MSLYLGSSTPSAYYLGNTAVSKVYLGNTQVYPAVPVTPTMLTSSLNYPSANNADLLIGSNAAYSVQWWMFFDTGSFLSGINNTEQWIFNCPAGSGTVYRIDYAANTLKIGDQYTNTYTVSLGTNWTNKWVNIFIGREASGLYPTRVYMTFQGQSPTLLATFNYSSGKSWSFQQPRFNGLTGSPYLMFPGYLTNIWIKNAYEAPYTDLTLGPPAPTANTSLLLLTDNPSTPYYDTPKLGGTSETPGTSPFGPPQWTPKNPFSGYWAPANPGVNVGSLKVSGYYDQL